MTLIGCCTQEQWLLPFIADVASELGRTRNNYSADVCFLFTCSSTIRCAAKVANYTSSANLILKAKPDLISSVNNNNDDDNTKMLVTISETRFLFSYISRPSRQSYGTQRAMH